MFERGLYEPFDPDSPAGIALVAANYGLAFFVGGLIARSRFVPAAIVLATALVVWGFVYWAGWHGHSVLDEVADSGLRALVCVAIAALGASAGLRVRRLLDAAFERARTRAAS